MHYNGCYKAEWLASIKTTLQEIGPENLWHDPQINSNPVVLKNLFDNKLNISTVINVKMRYKIPVPVNYTVYTKQSSKWSHT